MTLACLAPATEPAAAAARCKVEPGTKRTTAVERRVTCLINRTRARHGLGRLRREPHLRRAARRHSRRMVRTNVFSHSLGGPLSARIARSGYLKGRGNWALGETLVWASSARRALSLWMNSPSHRGVLLSRSVRDLGVGAAQGSPYRGGSGGFTLTANFARR